MKETWTEQVKWLYGCKKTFMHSAEVRKLMEWIQQGEEELEQSRMTAREVMESITAEEHEGILTMPKMGGKVEGTAPKNINAYSDGSLKHTKGHFWQVGGAGVWWPGRKEDSLSPEEKRYAQYKMYQEKADIFDREAKEGREGVMLWNAFNTRLNSSTRCELGAAILALLSPLTLNIGVDNATVVTRGNEIIDHLRKQEAVERKDAKGIKKLGGTLSVLHRPTPYKQGWPQMRDGDLWEVFADLVRQRGPHTVSITKVKGHATKEMVSQGNVQEVDKQGNDAADVAADFGAVHAQITVHAMGKIYCGKHKDYRAFMCRVQQFLTGLKKEESRLKQEAEKEKDPFQSGDKKKIAIPKHLRYPMVPEDAMHRMRGKAKHDRQQQEVERGSLRNKWRRNSKRPVRPTRGETERKLMEPLELESSRTLRIRKL